MNQSINEGTNERTNRSIDRSIHPSIHPSINQSINQPNDMWQPEGWITDKDEIVCSRAVVEKVSWQCRNEYLLPTAQHNTMH